MTAPRRSPLDAAHRALGAKLVPFGGWEMPLAYPAGTLAEHRACRADAVAFDVSHLGTVRVETDGFERLQATLTNDLARIAPGRAQYTHLLDDADASVLDDIIVWWRDRKSVV
jgi:aminomethyltransferase